ncbi:MAG: TonB-dependent receptor [Rhodomicrobium sp.]
MLRGAFAIIACAAALFGQAAIVAAQTPESGTQSAQPAPAQPAAPAPAPAAKEPAPAAPAAKEPGTPASPTPSPAASPAPVELPPIKIIQAPPAPAKPARNTAVPRKPVAARPYVPSARRPAAAARAPAAAPAPAEAAAETPSENAEQTVAMSPVRGSEIPLDKVPGAVSIVTSGEIARSGSPAIEDALQQNVPGVIISDVNGNPFSTDVQYRGYTASPVEGTPQGLAVYQNGVRINEVFGDTVNWDLIPSSAINSISVVAGNPLYGLNALGGALNIQMKDGFGFQGIESDTRGGSYGRIQESLQLGKQVDNFAAYVAIEGIHDDGWRFFSPSDVARTYVDLGVKDKNTEFHINFTGADTALGVVGPTPTQLLAQDYSSVFTSPQTTNNELAMVSMNGSTKLTDNWSLSGVAYWRSFHQSHADGNVSSTGDCGVLAAQQNPPQSNPYPGLLCFPTANNGLQPVTSAKYPNGVPTNIFSPAATIGEIDYSTNNANSFGGSLQATDKDKVFGLSNIFIAGASIDHGGVKSASDAELGTVNTQNWAVYPNGIYPTGPAPDYAPVVLYATTNYYSLFFTDTLDLTKALSATVGGRYNYEELDLFDPTGLLTGNHEYNRFNPMAGLTYKFNPNISAYGGYAEANRAPTPAELGCSNPLQPCVLAEFLVSDPNLQQVVSKTWQGGLRGNFSPFGYGNLNWTAGYFHAENYNDILTAIDPAIPTRGYFQNAGNTLREGVEASAKYRLGQLTLNANYAYVDATFLNNLTIPSPNNPFADANGNIFVHPGDHLPTIPAHRFKAGFDYSVTDDWKIGADMVLASSQYFFGDQSNQNPQLPGYGVVNIRTSYAINENVTVYGLINNVFDHKFATYAAFYDLPVSNVSGGISAPNLTNPDTITPAQPISFYGGIKLKFPATAPLEASK